MADQNKSKRGFYVASVEPKKTQVDKQNQLSRQTNAQNDTIEDSYKAERFVSPYYGHNVKDEKSFPFVRYGNKGSQYESLRDKKLQSDQELIEKYGTKYYEFVPSMQKDSNIARQERRQTEKAQPPYQEKNMQISDEEVESYPLESLELEDGDEEIEIDLTEEEPEVIEVVRQVKQTNPVKLDSLNTKPTKHYKFPPFELLKRSDKIVSKDTESLHYQRQIINDTLADFKIGGEVVHISRGPTVTLFEVKLEPGVRVDKVKSISRNLQMNLAVRSIRIQAPIPGKSTVGIEAPNQKTDLVYFGDLLMNQSFLKDGNPLNVVMGLDLGGQPVYADIEQMPHGLIAGSTGSGKSVCINAMIISMLYKAHPDKLKLILIDPKVVEFANYEDLPHLATPIITDPKLATTALKWAVEEMENRYQLFKANRVRDINTYNSLHETDKNIKEIPEIVIIIDELADLMSVASSDVEDYIRRIAQKARAAGIHLIVATQRPSTDIIKGTIKANIPTRIAFAVSVQVDSITILDHGGAEKLLGRGDMLYNDGASERRLQGAFITFDEIKAITQFVRNHSAPNYMFTEEELRDKATSSQNQEEYDAMQDELFYDIAKFVVEENTASINRIQKTFGLGFNRAQAIMLALENLEIVSENLGSRSREVLVGVEELEDILDRNLV